MEDIIKLSYHLTVHNNDNILISETGGLKKYRNDNYIIIEYYESFSINSQNAIDETRIINKCIKCINGEEEILKFKENFQYKFYFYSTEEEKRISKIYNEKDELISYKYYDKNNEVLFYVYFDEDKNTKFFPENINFDILQQSIREMEIEKLAKSFPCEFSQIKSETEIIMNAYQIYGKKKYCSILPINNNDKRIKNEYFTSTKFQNIDSSELNRKLFEDLGIESNFEVNFFVLPLRIQRHYYILLISLNDEKLFVINSQFESNNSNIFGNFQIENLIKFEIQLNYTCAYFMESICMVLIQYKNINDIIDECKNGIFVIKILHQFGKMFESNKDKEIMIPFGNEPNYYEIKINQYFSFGLKKNFYNSKFINFKNLFDNIHPNNDTIMVFASNQDKIISICNQIKNLLDRFHGIMDYSIKKRNLTKEISFEFVNIETLKMQKKLIGHYNSAINFMSELPDINETDVSNEIARSGIYLNGNLVDG